MKKTWVLLALLMMVSWPCSAQLTRLPSTVAKSFLKVPGQIKIPAEAFASSAAYQAHLRALERENFRDLDRMMKDYFLLDSRNVPPEILRQDEKRRRMLVQNWLDRDFYATQYMQNLRKNISVQAVQGKKDYTRYIPEESRLVIMGEVHQQNWMVNEVERAVLQLKNKYPDKNIYYASEFVDASGPGNLYILQDAKDVEHLVRKRPYYRAVTNRLRAAGVRVVGLEDPALSEEFIRMGRDPFFRQTAFAWKAVSASGLKKRNAYWTHIIRQIYAQDPRALVVVHAGLGYTNYNHANSLPWMLKEFNPFVTEFSEKLNTLLEKHAPVMPETYEQARALLHKNPIVPVYFVRHFKSKRAAVSVGCDLSIYRVQTRELLE